MNLPLAILASAVQIGAQLHSKSVLAYRDSEYEEQDEACDAQDAIQHAENLASLSEAHTGRIHVAAAHRSHIT